VAQHEREMISERTKAEAAKRGTAALHRLPIIRRAGRRAADLF
jgi:DNA invertase Pin-like site-specific DNA recombinase